MKLPEGWRVWLAVLALNVAWSFLYFGIDRPGWAWIALGFAGVLASPVTARTDWQLEIGDVKVVQRFDGETSALLMAFEGRLFNGDRRTLIATRRFETIEPAGGATAARGGSACAR